MEGLELVVQAVDEEITDKVQEGLLVIEVMGPDCTRLSKIHQEIDVCLDFLRMINCQLTEKAGLLQ